MKLINQLNLVLFENFNQNQIKLIKMVIDNLKSRKYNCDDLGALIIQNSRKLGCKINNRDLELIKKAVSGHIGSPNCLSHFNDLVDPIDHSPEHTEDDSNMLHRSLLTVPKLEKRYV